MQLIVYSTRPSFIIELKHEVEANYSLNFYRFDLLSEMLEFVELFIHGPAFLVLDSMTEEIPLDHLQRFECLNHTNILLSLSRSSSKRFIVMNERKVDSLMKSLGPLLQAAIMEKHISLPMDTLNSMEIAPTDIFVLEPEKICKMFQLYRAKDRIDQEVLAQLSLRSISTVFIAKSENFTFSKYFYESLESNLSVRVLTPREAERYYATMVRLVRAQGLVPRVKLLVFAFIENCIASSKATTSLPTVQNDTKGKTYRHFHLTNVLLFRALQKADRSAEELSALITANFFSDIFDLHDFDLHVEEENYDDHALKAHDLLEKYSFISPKIRRVILNHHGSIAGIGAASHIPDTIEVSSLLLLIAQDLGKWLDATGGDVTSGKEYVALKFNNPRINKVLDRFFSL